MDSWADVRPEEPCSQSRRLMWKQSGSHISWPFVKPACDGWERGAAYPRSSRGSAARALCVGCSCYPGFRVFKRQTQRAACSARRLELPAISAELELSKLLRLSPTIGFNSGMLCNALLCAIRGQTLSAQVQVCCLELQRHHRCRMSVKRIKLWPGSRWGTAAGPRRQSGRRWEKAWVQRLLSCTWSSERRAKNCVRQMDWGVCSSFLFSLRKQSCLLAVWGLIHERSSNNTNNTTQMFYSHQSPEKPVRHLTISW